MRAQRTEHSDEPRCHMLVLRRCRYHELRLFSFAAIPAPCPRLSVAPPNMPYFKHAAMPDAASPPCLFRLESYAAPRLSFQRRHIAAARKSRVKMSLVARRRFICVVSGLSVFFASRSGRSTKQKIMPRLFSALSSICPRRHCRATHIGTATMSFIVYARQRKHTSRDRPHRGEESRKEDGTEFEPAFVPRRFVHSALFFATSPT